MDRLSLKTQARTTVSCLQWFAVHLVDHQTHERRLKKEKKNTQCKQVRQLELLSVARAETLGIRKGPARGLRIRLVLINYIHIFSSFFEVALV